VCSSDLEIYRVSPPCMTTMVTVGYAARHSKSMPVAGASGKVVGR
jgi:hypothetical protein